MTPVPTVTDLEHWVATRVAYYLERPVDEVDHERSLPSQGFDSVFALALCGDIEDDFGLVVDPTLAWDFPRVSAIAGELRTLLEKAT